MANGSKSLIKGPRKITLFHHITVLAPHHFISFHHWFMRLWAAPEIWLWGLLLLHHFSRVQCWEKKLIFFSKHQATHRAKGNKNNPQALAQNSNFSKGKYMPKQA
jgi:hypothetical protein